MDSMTIAKEIQQQMGGRNRLEAMIGAKNFVALKRGLMFSHMPANGCNRLTVLLDGDDLYTVRFVDARGLKWNLKAEFTGIFCGDLCSLFTRQTGLALSL